MMKTIFKFLFIFLAFESYANAATTCELSLAACLKTAEQNCLNDCQDHAFDPRTCDARCKDPNSTWKDRCKKTYPCAKAVEQTTTINASEYP